MVRPITNWCPMMRIACRMAVRTTGSPARFASLPSKCMGLSRVVSSSFSRLPVSIRPQVDALTNSESLVPRWSFQRADVSLSAINRSAVSESGMRSKASAMHMSNTPSSEERSYCWRNASSPPSLALALRTALTSCLAVSWILSRIDMPESAAATSSRTRDCSSAR